MTRLTVFKLTWSDGYEIAELVNSEDYENLFLALNGVPRADDWKPIEVELFRENLGEPLLPSDAPYLASGTLLLRATAANRLSGVLAKYAELLPVRCAQADLLAVNVTNVIDALSQDASAVARFPDGRIMQIQHHEFHPDVVAGEAMFKIPDLRVSPIFVDQSFVSACRQADIRGLAFARVWEGEKPE